MACAERSGPGTGGGGGVNETRLPLRGGVRRQERAVSTDAYTGTALPALTGGVSPSNARLSPAWRWGVRNEPIPAPVNKERRSPPLASLRVTSRKEMRNLSLLLGSSQTT